MNNSAVTPYCRPMTLWSVEKMYFRQKPKLLVLRVVSARIRV